MTDPSPAAIEAAAEVLYNHALLPEGLTWKDATRAHRTQAREGARAALVAALPIVRAELAEQIEAASDNIALYDEGRKDAARIVRASAAP